MRPLIVLLACAMLAPSAGPVEPAAQRQIITRRWTPRDQQTARYAYIAFDVAPGTTRLSISYRYERANGANVVDFGVFEPGPLTLGSPAFRGWSGGARDQVTIAADEATPGYWPGPLPPGRWHAILGLYKVTGAGVDVELTVETWADGTTKAAPALRGEQQTVRRGWAWYKGALHTHTVHSDGALTVQQLADKALEEGLDFIAISDHNTTTQQLDPVDAPGLLLISGEEVTTPGGHFSVWGIEGDRAYIDFRLPAGSPDIGAAMTAARRRGAVIGINHPVDDCLACSWTHPVPPEVSAIEIANGGPGARQQAMAIWDTFLRQGRRLTAVGESDYHRGPAPLGTPSVRVWAHELSTSAILASLTAGRVVVMADGSLPPPELSVSAGQRHVRVGEDLRVEPEEGLLAAVEATAPEYRGARVDLYWNGEPVASARIPWDGRVEFARYPTNAGYLRVHVVGEGGQPLAITNPVFVETAIR